MKSSVLRQYFPILGLVLASVISVFVTASTDNIITATELGNIVLALLGAIALYVVPRLPGSAGYYTKTAITVLTAIAQGVLSFMSDGITMNEWAQVALTVFAAVGVVATTKFVPETEPVPAEQVRGPVVPDSGL
jgi:hypothetical protein